MKTQIVDQVIKDQNYHIQNHNFYSKIVSNELFSPYFSGEKIQEIQIQGKYVSDALIKDRTRKLFFRQREQSQTGGAAMILSAQTGKGKNHWINHVVRPLAAEENTKVLYLCNRNALSYQQVREAVKAVTPFCNEIVGWDKNMQEYSTGSLTIMTYHRFHMFARKKGANYFKKFSYCIADEYHFFYADALFNPDTGRILDEIPIVLAHCIRIYMTATPACVLAPIYCAEYHANCIAQNNQYEQRIEQYKRNSIRRYYSSFIEPYPQLEYDENFQISMISMPRDFSKYQDYGIYSDLKKLSDIIIESTEKWVIFIASKKRGRQLQEMLTASNISCSYVDRDSRKSTEISVRHHWEYLMETGNLGEKKVLIATSVLDNGFSIKDKNIGNIVIESEDQTEFLQQLGRVRLFDNQRVKLYFPPMTKQGRLHPQTYERILHTFAQFYGNKEIEEYPYPDAEIPPNPLRLIERKMSTDASDKIGYLALEACGNSKGIPYINYMARWIVKKIYEESKYYDQLLNKNEELAPIFYKVKWISEDPDALVFEGFSYENITYPNPKKLQLFFENFLNQELSDDDNDAETPEGKLFLDFSKQFMQIYKEIMPEDPSVNMGKNRKAWKSKAIQNHLDKLNKKFDLYYSLKKDEQGKFFKLMKEESLI